MTSDERKKWAALVAKGNFFILLSASASECAFFFAMSASATIFDERTNALLINECLSQISLVFKVTFLLFRSFWDTLKANNFWWKISWVLSWVYFFKLGRRIFVTYFLICKTSDLRKTQSQKLLWFSEFDFCMTNFSKVLFHFFDLKKRQKHFLFPKTNRSFFPQVAKV